MALAGIGKGRGFERVDTNSDGIITFEEMEQHRLERFGLADADGSGAVSRAEMEAAAQSRMAKKMDRMWSYLDSDGDGELSSAESAEHGSMRFARMDTNGDGEVTMEEARSHYKGHMRKSGTAPAE